ncbi:MAG: hypothetical protein M1823_002269 [Watsoniomyces obsoletus]|nr:MAG: hypothetical protein M1823_002269 [Watsoniomyces obsoletus]
MDAHIDPRLRGPSSSTSTSAPHLPALPHASLADNPVRLPLPARPPLGQFSDSPRPPYYHAPLAAANHASSHQPHEGASGVDNGIDPKRARACEACRGLKVRCESDFNNMNGPCKRCAKAGRECVVTAPTRKRQKKTDSRVAELEKKIDALTATLSATRSDSETRLDLSPVHTTTGGPKERRRLNEEIWVPSRDSPEAVRPSPTTGARSTSWTGGIDPRLDPRMSPTKSTAPPAPHRASTSMATVATRKRKQSGESETTSTTSPDKHVSDTRRAGPAPAVAPEGPSPASENPPSVHPFLIPKAPRNSTPSTLPPDPSPSLPGNVDALPPYEHADVVDRRILSAELATKLFDRYVREMAPQFPAVVFPPGTAAAEIRKTRPTLFLAILSIAAGTSHPGIQKTLTKEIMKVLATRVICNGEKSLEIVQALHVVTIWYWPPEHFDELKFYQLIHIAAVMAIDLGIGKRLRYPQPRQPPGAGAGPSKGGGFWREHPWRRSPQLSPESAEARRTWLVCYFECANVSMSLRRPNLLRWTSYMADCVEFLETSPEAVESDKAFCQWIRIQHIAEDVGVQLSLDDPSLNPGISDLKVQYTLKTFERQLADWRAQLPKELDSPTVQLNAHVLDLYMHEIAIHIDHIVDDFRAPCGIGHDTGKDRTGPARPASEPLTAIHIDALMRCVSAIHSIIGIFLSFDVEKMRVLPIIHFVRVAYAVVCLTKMYFAATSPNSELGKVISVEDLKVERNLDGLLEGFRLAAEGDRCKPASKFMMVLVMLKTWFQNPKGVSGGPGGGGGGAGGVGVKGGPAGCNRGSAIASMSMALQDHHEDCPIKKVIFSGPGGAAASGYAHHPPGTPFGGGGGDTAGRETPSNHATPRYTNDATSVVSSYSTANTPLQLLSEVAMGNSNGISEAGGARRSATPGGGGVSSGNGISIPVSAARWGLGNGLPENLPPRPTSSSTSRTAGTSGGGSGGGGGSVGPGGSWYTLPNTNNTTTTSGSLDYPTSGSNPSLTEDTTSPQQMSSNNSYLTPNTNPGGWSGNEMMAGMYGNPGMLDLDAGFGQAFGMTLGDDDFFSHTMLDDIFSFRLLNDGNLFGGGGGSFGGGGGGGGPIGGGGAAAPAVVGNGGSGGGGGGGNGNNANGNGAAGSNEAGTTKRVDPSTTTTTTTTTAVNGIGGDHH